ncbi:protein HIRA-like [Dorcoceras hygrometricum]|uniref:Protein HIRA-like n=1 Tax=Dorcoceras hygrometricum TaxID=472368 RepID=A0A2Z7BWH2_9LAMI|nr:protein HIRA-like [Dorcoceras hygrometricum]
MLHFNLSKRRRVAPTNGYSNQRLVTQQKHILRNASADFLYDINSQHKKLFTSSDSADQDVQMVIDRHGDSTDSSADYSLHFNANDISTEDDVAFDQFILPSSAADISASLAALRESFSKLVANQTRDSRKVGDAHSEVLCKINHVERVFLDSLAAQNEAFRADIRNDLLEFRVETQEQLASLGAHLAELIAFVTKGSDDKKGESSISRPRSPPDDQNRPSGGSDSRADDPRRYGGGTISRECGNRGGDGRRRGDSSGSSKRRRSDSGGGSGGRINYGPYLPPKRDAEYWISGKRQF